MQRSFLRDYLKLCSSASDEFKGQVELLPVNEHNVTSFALVIRPKKGLYAHGAFRFLVTASDRYPNSPPSISCLNPPWHPNIDATSIENNICLNILSHWCKDHNLKSMVSALVFLFYEPNFDDPLHHNGMVGNDSVRIEKQVHLSLAGCNVGSIRFIANEEWCHWAKENSLLPVVPPPSPVPEPAEVDQETQHNPPSTFAPPELQQQLSTLSTYYQSNAPIDFDAADFDISADFTDSDRELDTLHAFLRHITLQERSSSQPTDEHELYRSHTRYYYAEMCSSDYYYHLLTWSRESHAPAVSRQLSLIQTPLQVVEVGTWEPYFNGDTKFRKRIERLLDPYANAEEEPDVTVDLMDEQESTDASEDSDVNSRTGDTAADAVGVQCTELANAEVSPDSAAQRDKDDLQTTDAAIAAEHIQMTDVLDAETPLQSSAQQDNITNEDVPSQSTAQGAPNENVAAVIVETQLKVLLVNTPSDSFQQPLVEEPEYSNTNYHERAPESLSKIVDEEIASNAANLHGDNMIHSVSSSHLSDQGEIHYSVSEMTEENKVLDCPDVTLGGSDSFENRPTALCGEPVECDATTDTQSEEQVSEVENTPAGPTADADSPLQDSNDVSSDEGHNSEYVVSPEVIGSAVAVYRFEAEKIRKIHCGLRLLFMLLKPSWWICFQTRWPPFTAPGYLFPITDYDIRHFGCYFYRASALQLIFELNFLSKLTTGTTSFILMDPLALSPFSPVLNRVVIIPSELVYSGDDESRDVSCMSIEWISPVQSLLNCFTRSPGEHFRGSALLSMGSLLSNWLAYFSRMELHGTSLGYSHYRDTYLARPMGIACMYPATLGCGQIPLLDAWPLQLLLHSVRACCSTLVYVSSLLAPCSNFPHPRFRISFADVDCI